jgi:2-polyprenyl-3-methyl-5-hydroxy-6-metoxy-1,4-benzoquinol methylase
MAEDVSHDFPCDLCGKGDAMEVPHVREYTGGQVLHICKNCGLIYAKKRRSCERVAEVWTTQIFGDPNVLSATSYSSRNPHVRSRMVYLAEFIHKSIPLKGKRVCDIGAGEGQFLEIIEPMGAEVFGIEPSPTNCKLLEESGFPFYQGTVERYSQAMKEAQPSRLFDLVTLMFTLECTQKPLTMLEIAHDMLKSEGHIAVHTGSRILVPFKKPLHNFLGCSPVDTHPVHLSFNTLKGLLARAAFQVTQFNPYVENDNLCVLARKTPKGTKIEWQGDDSQQVADFFERWHKESLHYR